MTLREARAIYDSSSGHSKEELIECLRVLNAQEVEFTTLQFLAIKDAHDRLGIPIQDILDN